MLDQEAISKRVHACAETLIEYTGTDGVNALKALLDVMVEAYLADLAYIDQEQLAFKQGALQQVMKLHDLVTIKGKSDPRI